MELSRNRRNFQFGRPVSFIHVTGDGPFHLLVRATTAGWDSLHWGPRLAGAGTFKTLQEANEYVLRRFQALYYGHRCSTGCVSVDGAAIHKYDDPWGMIPE